MKDSYVCLHFRSELIQDANIDTTFIRFRGTNSACKGKLPNENKHKC